MKTVNFIFQQLVVHPEADLDDVVTTIQKSPAKLIVLISVDNEAVADFLSAEAEVAKHATGRRLQNRVTSEGGSDGGAAQTFVLLSGFASVTQQSGLQTSREGPSRSHNRG